MEYIQQREIELRTTIIILKIWKFRRDRIQLNFLG